MFFTQLRKLFDLLISKIRPLNVKYFVDYEYIIRPDPVEVKKNLLL